MVWAGVFVLALALGQPAAAQPFPVGTWFGQGEPHDKGEMWIARMGSDGSFRVHFRACSKGHAMDRFEEGRWVLAGDMETIDITKVDGLPMPRRDRYRILAHDGQRQTYRHVRTGFVFTSYRVAADYVMPGCDMVS